MDPKNSYSLTLFKMHKSCQGSLIVKLVSMLKNRYRHVSFISCFQVLEEYENSERHYWGIFSDCCDIKYHFSPSKNVLYLLFQFVDRQRFFIASDLDLLLDIFKTELNFLQCTWKNMLGRPVVTLELNKSFLGNTLLYMYFSSSSSWMLVVSACQNDRTHTRNWPVTVFFTYCFTYPDSCLFVPDNRSFVHWLF